MALNSLSDNASSLLQQDNCFWFRKLLFPPAPVPIARPYLLLPLPVASSLPFLLAIFLEVLDPTNSPTVMCILCTRGCMDRGTIRGQLWYNFKFLQPSLMARWMLFLLDWLLLYKLSSLPAATRTTIRPLLFRPVRPIRCTRRTGLFAASKHTMRSTSPISSPSSPTHVATRVL